MDFNLNNQQTIQAADAEFTTESRKLYYSSPVLQDYGSINILTQGGGSSLVDGVNSTKKAKP